MQRLSKPPGRVLAGAGFTLQSFRNGLGESRPPVRLIRQRPDIFEANSPLMDIGKAEHL